jgi:hypothetical protein
MKLERLYCPMEIEKGSDPELRGIMPSVSVMSGFRLILGEPEHRQKL